MALPTLQKSKRASIRPVLQKPKKDTLKPYRPIRDVKPISGKPSVPAFPAGGATQTVSAPQSQKAEFDKPYYDTIGDINQREQSGLIDLEGAEKRVRYDFGIDDPTNPFSRIEGLKRAFLQRKKGENTNIAASGQLYSGAHQRAVARTQRDEAEANQGLRDQYEAALRDIGEARKSLKYGSEDSRTEAFEDWLARAPEADVPLNGPTEAQYQALHRAMNGGSLKGYVSKKAVVKHVPKKKVKDTLKPKKKRPR